LLFVNQRQITRLHGKNPRNPPANSPGNSNIMKIFFISDIVGRPGRRVLKDHLTSILESRRVDLCVANGENAAAGSGITPALAEELLGLPVDVLTSGNHIWDKKEILEYIPHQPRLVRPANFPPGAPGQGFFVGATRGGFPYAVISLQGRVFMPPSDCPFRTMDRLLAELSAEIRVILVDFHAEATAEKQALGWYLDGRVTAVIGTHTHIPTADESILPGGTAYLTDAGMTGPHDSVIGVDKGIIVSKFLNQIPAKFEPASGDVRLNAVEIEVDPVTGRAVSIQRFCLKIRE
jgi:metallophosphoesterase (TIGR00282 family)